jgi:hypothetical protein
MGVLCDGLSDAVGLRAIVVMGIVSRRIGVGQFQDQVIVMRCPKGSRRFRMPGPLCRTMDMNSPVSMSMFLSRRDFSISLRAVLVFLRGYKGDCTRKRFHRFGDLKVGKKMMHAVRRRRGEKKDKECNGP